MLDACLLMLVACLTLASIISQPKLDDGKAFEITSSNIFDLKNAGHFGRQLSNFLRMSLTWPTSCSIWQAGKVRK